MGCVGSSEMIVLPYISLFPLEINLLSKDIELMERERMMSLFG